MRPADGRPSRRRVLLAQPRLRLARLRPYPGCCRGRGRGRSGRTARPASLYLDISAVRIQEWLARTPDLKFRRGASIMLSEETAREAWPPARLPAGTRWNTEAGDLDGVISLVAEEPADKDVAGSVAAARLATAAAEVTRALRQRPAALPGAGGRRLGHRLRGGVR